MILDTFLNMFKRKKKVPTRFLGLNIAAPTLARVDYAVELGATAIDLGVFDMRKYIPEPYERNDKYLEQMAEVAAYAKNHGLYTTMTIGGWQKWAAEAHDNRNPIVKNYEEFYIDSTREVINTILYIPFTSTTALDMVQFLSAPNLEHGTQPYFGNWGLRYYNKYIRMIQGLREQIPHYVKLSCGVPATDSGLLFLKELKAHQGLQSLDAINLQYYYLLSDFPYNKTLAQLASEPIVHKLNETRRLIGNKLDLNLTELGVGTKERYAGFEITKAALLAYIVTFVMVNTTAKCVIINGYNPRRDNLAIVDSPSEVIYKSVISTLNESFADVF